MGGLDLKNRSSVRFTFVRAIIQITSSRVDNPPLEVDIVYGPGEAIHFVRWLPPLSTQFDSCSAEPGS
jgi:hypothetical protein